MAGVKKKGSLGSPVFFVSSYPKPELGAGTGKLEQREHTDRVGLATYKLSIC
jgi:hypothetical protein